MIRFRFQALVLTLASAVGLSSGAASPPSGDPALPLTAEREIDGFVAPPVDVERLRAEDRERAGLPGIPRRIGYRMETALTPAESGIWERIGDDRLWRMKIDSAGALWTVVGFTRFDLPAGAELYVYDAGRRTVVGPKTTRDARSHGQLWFPPIEGDRLIVELFWPAYLGQRQPELEIGVISHGYEPFGSIGRGGVSLQPGGPPDGDDPNRTRALGDSGPCNVDINCPLGSGWQDAKRGVVILLSDGSSFCSGSLVNTTARDCRPYVLTADHCGVGPTTTYGFNFELSGCGGGTANPPTTETITGGTLLASDPATDTALVEMDGDPPASFQAYFNGWDARGAAAGKCWAIHHPSGDAKKISYNADPLIDGINYGPSHWRVTEWEQGTTEGGSSGSPLFDVAERIVGQLHGGLASCTNNSWDEYGKLSAAWTGGGTSGSRLSDWLDPGPTGELFLDGLDATICAFQPAGQVTLDAAAYRCVDSLSITVRDDSLQGQSTITVTVVSTTESTAETVTLLAEQAGSGVFRGSLPLTDAAAAAGDGVLSVAHGDSISVTYVDADDGAGGTNVSVEATADVDCVAPTISNVTATGITGSRAQIQWQTDELADSRVTYGVSLPGSQFANDAAFRTAHDLTLPGLVSCTDYLYTIVSADAVGNTASEDNQGAGFSFTTNVDLVPDFPSTDTPLPIPDDDALGVTSSVFVAEQRTILDVDVEVTITHGYTGDLTLTLIAPGGQTVVLAAERGAGGNDFLGTIFDDEAVGPISVGAPPFAGSFQPETPLSALDGLGSVGNWQLLVVDGAEEDVGVLEGWRLILTHPPQFCGSHASYSANRLVSDSCPGAGGGNDNGLWESGEEVRFELDVINDGSEPLTGLTVQLVPLTPGVIMLDDTADLPDLLPKTVGTTAAPHLTARLPAGLPCGAPVEFQVDVQTSAGNFVSTFQQPVGLTTPGGGQASAANFDSGIGPDWTVVDGFSDGNSWFADAPSDPSGCANDDPLPPLSIGWAAVDSDCAGNGVTLDESLISPVIDLSGASTATLRFDHWFRRFGAEKADVDVRSSLTGGSWVNVARFTGGSTSNPSAAQIDLTSVAAGASDVELRWHYYDATFEWYWYVDNVAVDFTSPGSCQATDCPVPPAPPPIGPSLSLDRLADDGSALSLTWGEPCPPAGRRLLHGPIDQVGAYQVGGALCAPASPEIWSQVPAGDLWFVIVSDDGSATEGSWGLDSSGNERNPGVPSGQCGSSFRDSSAICP